jgi:hypothetical protein
LKTAQPLCKFDTRVEIVWSLFVFSQEFRLTSAAHALWSSESWMVFADGESVVGVGLFLLPNMHSLLRSQP